MGGGRLKPTTEYDADDFDFHIATNLEPAFHFCQLSHPLLKASGYGSIVFISSVAGVVSLECGSIYSLTKGNQSTTRDKIKCFFLLNQLAKKYFTGALNQLARNLACEWAKDGIRANAVAPSAIKTPLSQQVNQQDTIYIFFCNYQLHFL